MNAATILSLCSLASAAAAAMDAESMTHARKHSNDKGDTLPYRIFIPPQLPPRPVPLLLFMHGAGERGSDNRAQLKHGVREMILWSRNTEPVIIVAPQCPSGQRWVDVDWSKPAHTMPPEPSFAMRMALEIINSLQREFAVDPQRLYVTGLSMGGYGTWDIIQRHPEKFAAAMPLCGGGDTAGAALFKDLPIWAFHGDQDGAVPVSRSRTMVEALKQVGGKIRYTEYPGVGHDCWTRTYADPAVLQWLFSQRR